MKNKTFKNDDLAVNDNGNVYFKRDFLPGYYILVKRGIQ